MKIVILTILIFLSLESNAQFDFVPDTLGIPENRYFPEPDWDSVQFEFRLWELTSLAFPPTCYVLTYDNNETWHYARYMILPEQGKKVDLDSVRIEVDHEQLWTELLDFNVLRLLSQDSVTASIRTEKGHLMKIPSEQLEKMLGTDGVAYRVELLKKGKYRSYYYDNPERWVDSNKNAKDRKYEWIVPEHHDMVGIIKTIFDKLEYKEVYKRLVDYFLKERAKSMGDK